MLISYRLLQTYFKKTLPTPEEVARLLSEHIFEIEGIDKKMNDVVLDVNVLPDRAPYCLSHQGIASEFASIRPEYEFTPRVIQNIPGDVGTSRKVIVEAKEYCDRYILAELMDVEVKESPKWLTDYLESLGQRSINLVVDLTNFVMLDIGQPLHAFDASKVEGEIQVRFAHEGEEIITLDKKQIKLTPEVCVISDSKKALAIAGVKGGNVAEVTKQTNHILLESAHFKSSLVRVASGIVGIKNDSSKRFENNVANKRSIEGIQYFIALLKKECGELLVNSFFDSSPEKPEEKKLEVGFQFIKAVLGAEITDEEIIDCLTRNHLRVVRVGEKLSITIPEERKDLEIPEDICDEVGRLWGLTNLKGVLPKNHGTYEALSSLTLRNRISNFLVTKGYSEIYSYSLTNKGHGEILNPLASDKNFVRDNLSSAMEEKLVQNVYYADLLNLDKIRLFEIGKVYTQSGEKTHLSIGVAYKRFKKGERVNDEIKKIRDELVEFLNLPIQTVCTVDDSGGLLSFEGKTIGVINQKDGILEIELDQLFDKVKCEDVSLGCVSKHTMYTPVSTFPFISRDIAVFVPGEAGNESFVIDAIKKHGTTLLIRFDLFDVFTKTFKETEEVKTSYAYRMVFQSYEKTLTNEEVDTIVANITNEMNSREGWQVR